jgi:magnesium-protoporphyrin IX monomethyl ester (oxidative) cyclase
LLRGHNKLWIRFFLVAVYATMYVRDHDRPAFYDAIRMSPSDYDAKVFRICTQITRQVFPITLDTDSPAFVAGLEAMRHAMLRIRAAKAQGGIAGRLNHLVGIAAAGAAFARLYLHRAPKNPLPATIRLAPAW